MNTSKRLILCLAFYLLAPSRQSLAQESMLKDNFVALKGGNYPLGKENIPIYLSPFAISPTEVTYGQMAMFALYNGQNPRRYHEVTWGEPDAERAAVNVNWFDAIRYANWLSVQQGYRPAYQIFTKYTTESGIQWRELDPSDPDYWKVKDGSSVKWDSIYWDRSAKGYRLPTNAEWEYAASGFEVFGRRQVYPGTDLIDSLKYYALYFDNSGGRAHKVGTRLPNALGLYDLGGNVWEWCFDMYEESYQNFQNQRNPVSNNYHEFPKSQGLLRGGSWHLYTNHTLVTYHYRSNELKAFTTGSGFRLVRTL